MNWLERYYSLVVLAWAILIVVVWLVRPPIPWLRDALLLVWIVLLIVWVGIATRPFGVRNHRGRTTIVSEMLVGFVAPFNVKETVERLLATVPHQHMAGLRQVVVTTKAGLPGRLRRRVYRYRSGKRVAYADVRGFYEQPGYHRQSSIVLLADNILQGWSPWIFRLRLFRDLLVGPTLYHELGHHIHATQKPNRKDPEILAEEWADSLGKNHVRTHYGWMWPIWPLVRVLWRIAGPAG